MDKKVFRKYMDKEIIQKTIIFADTLGLSIDSWHPAKEESHNPYRIYFYEKKNIVGYIDANITRMHGNVLNIEYIENFPTTLFTPIGNVKASYSDTSIDEGTFNYEVATPSKENLLKIDGSTKFYKTPLEDVYNVRASIEFKDNSEDHYQVSINNYYSHGTLHISKNYGLDDYYINTNNNSLVVSHKTDVVNGLYKNTNNIKVERDAYFSPVIAKYDFNDSLSYERIVTLENKESNPYKFDTIVDIEKVIDEIKLHDPRIIEIIDEVRDLLTVYSNKKPFSIYDKLTYHSFKNSNNKIKRMLIRDNNVSKNLAKNPVLQKMDKHSKTS